MSGNYTNTYRNARGRFETESNAVEKLIPDVGVVPDGKGKNKCLERLRRAINAYHDVYNNGCGNRDNDIRYYLKVGVCAARELEQDTIAKMEEQMDKYIMDAYIEQTKLGTIHPMGQ